jgi:hypothetical protein
VADADLERAMGRNKRKVKIAPNRRVVHPEAEIE